MRFQHQDGTVVHVAWHVDVVAGDVVDVLDRYAEPVRARLGVDRLGLGLWWGADAVADLLADPAAVRRLRSELARRDLEVLTLDAVRFDATRQPDWTDPRRGSYTLSCAKLLTELLPDTVVRGSIGTLPLGRRALSMPTRGTLAQEALDGLADGLAELHWSTGRRIRVGLVPEPGYAVAGTEQAVSVLSTVDNEWIGVALDTCHLAVAFETPTDSVRRLARACVPVVKAQLSAAAEIAGRAAAALEPWSRGAAAFVNGTRFEVDDLADAVAGGLPAEHPWRVHIHVPVTATPTPPMTTTADVTLDSVEALFDRSGGAQTDHVEVGAGIAPGPDMIGTAVAELAWTRDRLIETGLKEI